MEEWLHEQLYNELKHQNFGYEVVYHPSAKDYVKKKHGIFFKGGLHFSEEIFRIPLDKMDWEHKRQRYTVTASNVVRQRTQTISVELYYYIDDEHKVVLFRYH